MTYQYYQIWSYGYEDSVFPSSKFSNVALVICLLAAFFLIHISRSVYPSDHSFFITEPHTRMDFIKRLGVTVDKT